MKTDRWGLRRARRTVKPAEDDAPDLPGGRIGLLITNVGVLTALLVYFGWRRSKTQAAALGIDESVLGMTTQEYVLRSVGPVLLLIVVLTAAGLVWIWIQYGLDRLVAARPAAAPWLSLALAVVFPLPFLVVLALRDRWPGPAYAMFPAAVAAGLLLLLYRGYLHRRWGRPVPEPFGMLRALVLVAAAICLFWSASNYAEVLGNRLAADFEANLTGQPSIEVYSTDPLRLEAPSIRTDVLDPKEGAAFRFRYSGLRLLDHRGGKYLLVTDRWTLGGGIVLILPDDKIRVDFVRG